MKSQLNEVQRLQKIAGILSESFIDEAKHAGTAYSYEKRNIYKPLTNREHKT